MQNNGKYKVIFQSGESNIHPGRGCNFMLVKIGESVLESEIEFNSDMENFDEYSYPILKEDIIRQARKIGISENELKFYWD